MKVEKRNPNLKAKQLRRTGMIPGCIYGKHLEESLLIQIPENEADQLLKSHTTGSKVQLSLGRKKYTALLKEVANDPIKNQIEHLSFQDLVKGEMVNSSAHIVLHSKEKVSDLIRQELYEISYKAIPSKLVEKVEIDLEGKKAGFSIRVEDLDIAKNKDIELQTPVDSLVLAIVDHKRIAEELTEEEQVTGETVLQE